MDFAKRSDSARLRARQRRTTRNFLLILAVLAALAAAGVIAAKIFNAGTDRVEPLPVAEPQSSQSGYLTAETPQSAQSIKDLVQVSGKPGAPPVLVMERPVDVARTKSAVIETGEGRTIEAGAPVLTQIYRFSGEDGSELGSSEFVIGKADGEDLGQEFADLVTGTTEGSRLLVFRPTSAGKTEVLIMDVIPTIATGADNADSSGPLTVEFNDEGPVISHEKEKPVSLTVQTLKKGEGPQVGTGDEVLLQHSIVTWSGGALVSSSWHDGVPTTHLIDELWPGLRDALVDQRVGSRLAVTIPADQANGEDTLVAVIDVLGTVHADE